MATYTIKSLLGSNLYLSVDSGRTNVSLKTGATSANQQWIISSLRHNVEVSSGNLRICALNAVTSTWNCDVSPTTTCKVNFVPYGQYYKIQLASNTTRYLTASGSSSGANVSWTTTSSGNSVYWDVQETELIVPPASHIIQMPNRTCNWNQYYTDIANATGDSGKKSCTITTALDLMNFYGPNSYTIQDAKVGWSSASGIAWGTAWPGNFRAGTKYPMDGQTLSQAEFFALIRSEIAQNRPVIVNVGTGNSKSHTVMCYGYQNGGFDYSDFLVMDPAGTGLSGASNKEGQKRTLWAAMDYSSKTDGIWSIRFTYSKA